MTAAYIRNKCYNKRLEQTSYYVMTGRKPNLSNLTIFGSECYAYRIKRNSTIDVLKVFLMDMTDVVLAISSIFQQKNTVNQEIQTDMLCDDDF